jgi:hypothetical protein
LLQRNPETMKPLCQREPATSDNTNCVWEAERRSRLLPCAASEWAKTRVPRRRGVVPSDRPASEHGIWSRCRARLGPIRWGDHAVHKFENSERSKKKSRQLKFNTPLFSGFIFIFHFVLFYVIKFLIIAILLLLKLSLLNFLLLLKFLIVTI